MDETKTDVANSEMSIDVVGLYYARKRASEVLSNLEDLDIYNNILVGIDETCIDLLEVLETLQNKSFGQLRDAGTACFDEIKDSVECLESGDGENKPGLEGIINYMDDMRNRLSFMDASTAAHFEFLDQVENYGENFASDDDGLTSNDEAMIAQFNALRSKPIEEWIDEDYAKYNECISYDPNLVYASLKPSFEAIMAKPESQWTAQDIEFINQYLYYEYAVLDQSGEVSYNNYMNTGVGDDSLDGLPFSKLDYMYGNIDFDENGVWIPSNSWDRTALINYLGYDPGPITREVVDYVMTAYDSRVAASYAKQKVYADFTKNKTTIYDDYTDFGWIEDLYEIYSYAGTIVCGFAEGVIKVGENIIDGGLMFSGQLTAGIADLFGCAEYAEDTRCLTANVVGFDFAGNLYNVVTDDILHLDYDIAQGGLRTVSRFGGTMVGYGALTIATGGTGTPYVIATAAAVDYLAGKGSGAENGFNIVGADGVITADEFNKVAFQSDVAGVLAAASGLGVDKMGTMYRNTGNMMYRLAAGGCAVSEPFIVGLGDYFLIGKNAMDESGNPLYKDWNDYANQTGFYTNMFIASGAGFLGSGSKHGDADVNARVLDDDRVPVYYYNMYGDPELDMRNIYARYGNLAEMTELEESLAWSEYFSNRYGAVDHLSGIDVKGYDGSIVHPNAARSNAINYVNPETRTIVVGGIEVRTNLSDEQLIRFANDFYNLNPPITSLENYPLYGVVESASSLQVDSSGRLGINWVADNGSVIETRRSSTILANSQIDRYGNPNGIFVGKMDVDASGGYVGANYDARSLPYAEGSQQYTVMTVLKDINSDTVSSAINGLDKNSELYNDIIGQLNYDGIRYTINPDTGDIFVDCFEAQIASAYGHSGGGVQYELPLRAGYLKKLGFLDY